MSVRDDDETAHHDGGGDLTLDAGLSLLDRQILAGQGSPTGNVDDLEVAVTPVGLQVTALLSGPLALGPRVQGRLGTWMVAVARRLAPGDDPRPRAIPIGDIRRLTAAVELRTQPVPQRLEKWCEQHIIASIPGAGRASE